MRIRIHYHRRDKNYAHWNVWLWPENYAGQVVKFSESDDFGVIATAGSWEHRRIGFVIRSIHGKMSPDRYIEHFVEGKGGLARDGAKVRHCATPRTQGKGARF